MRKKYCDFRNVSGTLPRQVSVFEHGNFRKDLGGGDLYCSHSFSRASGRLAAPRNDQPFPQKQTPSLAIYRRDLFLEGQRNKPWIFWRQIEDVLPTISMADMSTKNVISIYTEE
jgi:hypothetical protein